MDGSVQRGCRGASGRLLRGIALTVALMLTPATARAYCVIDPEGRAGPLPLLAERDPKGVLREVDRRLALRPSVEQAGWLWASAAIAEALLDRPEQTYQAARRGLAVIARAPAASSRWQLMALEAGTSEDEPTARAAIDRLRRAYRALSRHRAAGACLLENIGRLQLILSDMRAATVSLDTAYRLTAHPGLEVERAWITLILSTLMTRSNEPGLAGSFLDEGLALARPRRLRMTIANIQYARGKTLLARYDYAAADTAFAEAAVLARRWQGAESAAFADLGRCEAQLALGDLAQAESLCAGAAAPLALTQSIKPLRLLQARIAHRQGRPRLAARYLAAVLDGNRESSVGPTLTAALKERARLRAERGDYRGAYRDLTRHLAEIEAANAEALHRQSATLRARLQFDRQRAQNAMLRAELANADEHNGHRIRLLILSVVAAAAVIALLTATLMMGRRHRRLLQRLVDTDALTGLPNRRGIHQAATAMQHRMPASVVMLDVDHFKRFNDRYGHAAGDAALTSFARAARDALRPDDLVGRWGGEEFVIVLAATDLVTAGGVIERLRSNVARLPLSGVPDIRLSFSAGIAAWHPDRDDLDTVMAAADAALYRAKEGGRDRTVIHRESSAGSTPVSVPHAA